MAPLIGDLRRDNPSLSSLIHLLCYIPPSLPPSVHSYIHRPNMASTLQTRSSPRSKTTTNGGRSPAASTSVPLPSSHSPPPPTATKPKPKRSLRILCFGDSLTSGYSRWGTISHPYSQALTTVLSRAFPSLNVEAHVDGVPGDVVNVASPNSRFLRRIEPKFLTKGGGTPYDWTIVLGGTNDLALSCTPASIYESLKQIWAVPLSKGGRVLACTVPEAGVTGERAERAKERRDELNALIQGHRQENL